MEQDKLKVLFVATMHSHIMNFHLPYLQYWYDKGYEVHVATQMDRTKYSEQMIQYPFVIWHHIDFSRNPFSKQTVVSYRQLKLVMITHKFELMHTHTPIASVVSRLAANKCKIPKVVYTAHGFHFFKGAPLQNWLIYYPMEKIMAKYTDTLITMNEEDYQLAKAKFKTRQPNSVYKVNGVGLEIDKYTVDSEVDYEFKKSLGLEKDDFVITIVAELIKRKNHKQIIDAMESLKQTHPDIKVLFVGDGILYDELKKVIRQKKLDDTIYVLGYRRDVAKILNITDCCGLFSHHEGLPKNIMEAMAAGKPVVASNIRGNQDLVVDRETGYLVRVDDVKSTIKAITKVKNENNHLGENAKKIIEMYRIEEVLVQTGEIYANITCNK